MIKHIFSDMDGTILDDKGRLSKRNIEVVKKTNIPFTLVSARSPKKMKETIDNLGLAGTHVALNGAIIFEKNEKGSRIIHKVPLDYKLIKRLVLDVRSKFPKIGISLYDEENWNVDVVNIAIAQEQRIVKVNYTLVDFEEYFSTEKEVLKVSFIEYEKEIFEQVAKYVEENYGDEKLTIQKSLHGYLEITDADAKKSNAVNYIKEKRNLKKHELAAFGDGQNDIAMLEAVEYAVVMENASEEVKKHASYVTKSNNDDGVAYALENYIAEFL